MLLYLILTILNLAVSNTAYSQRFDINTTATNFNSTNCRLSITEFNLGQTYSFQLENCRVGDCHAIIDNTYRLRWGSPDPVNPSVFNIVSMVGTNFVHNSAGIVFRPTQQNVIITLTVQSCHNFYKIHPFESIENCTAPVNVSNIIRGLPFCDGVI